MPRLKICKQFRFSHAQWAEITSAGRIPHTQDPNLRRALEWDTWHYRETRKEFASGIRKKELREALKASATLADDLVRIIDRHPEMLALVAGAAAVDYRIPKMLTDIHPRECLDFYVEGLKLFREWVHAIAANNPVGRERRFPGGPNADPPTQQFISVLVHKWRAHGRSPSNWVGITPDDEPAADLTKFVHRCLSTAGLVLTLEAVRGRLRTVLKGMREKEADGRR